MDDWNGRVVVVTGAGSGIGRALAIGFARRGARVAAADVELAALEATSELLLSEVPDAELLTTTVDVSDAEQVEGLADQVYDRWGEVDLLCNNAGVFVGGLLWERSPADFDFTLGVNLYGILHGIRAFVPRMIERGTEAHVVNTSSIAGLLGSPFAVRRALRHLEVRGTRGVRVPRRRPDRRRVARAGPCAVPGHDPDAHRAVRT